MTLLTLFSLTLVELRDAIISTRKLRKRESFIDWTLKQSFFVVMGGVRVQKTPSDAEAACNLSKLNLAIYQDLDAVISHLGEATLRANNFPGISDIDDKSKSTLLAKG